jgi:PDZ domain
VVFSIATQTFLDALAQNAQWLGFLSVIGSPLITERSELPKPNREELVVVASPFFPHKLAQGYGPMPAAVVESINGTPIRSLKHLVAVLRDLKDDYVVMRFDQLAGETLVFPRKEITAATEDILNDNGVRAQGSADLMAVWTGKAPK